MPEPDTPADTLDHESSRAAEALLASIDDRDQDVEYLASYARGKMQHIARFNARTYLMPLEKAAGEVVLDEVAVDSYRNGSGYFYFDEDGRFTWSCSNEVRGPVAVAEFAEAYADEGLELRPKHIEEVRD